MAHNMQIKNKKQFTKLRRMAFFPLAIFYMELILRLWSGRGFWGLGLLYILLFSFGAGMILNLLVSIWPKKQIGRVLNWVFLIFFTILFTAQTVFYTVFQGYAELNAVAIAGEVLADDFFMGALRMISTAILPILLLLLPIALSLALEIWKRRPIRIGELRRVALATLLLHVLLIGSILINTAGYFPLRHVYRERFVLSEAVQNFGLVTSTRLDLQYSIFGRPEADIAGALEVMVPLGESPAEQTGETSPPPEDGLQTDEAEEPEEPEPEPVVFGYNILDIDFDALIETETREAVLEMHAFFSARQATRQNEFTGMFEGKNLIWIIGEAFHTLAIHPEITPTLYRLSQKGFIFPNFYTPDTGFSTTGGEFGTMVGLIPTTRQAFRDSHDRYMPFGFGNLFGALGYTTLAFHNHTYTFNGRHLSHPNMGYIYRAIGNGLDITRQWPASDLEMMQATVDDFINEPHFHVYYLTVSGHLEYNFFGNSMAARHQQSVADLPYSVGPRAFLATQIELDLAIQYLIDRLDAAGRLEETVFVLSGDHYPYGLSIPEMEELGGAPIEEPIFDLHHSPLIIWNATMEEPIVIESFSSFYDIMPTLANLFALPFDSRLVMGVDLLSDAVPFVPFATRSWISQYGRFNARSGEFRPHPEIDPASVPENHVQLMQARFVVMEHFSGRMMEFDYYRIVLGN